MKFEEVLPAFREGKKIRRSLWPKDEYIYGENGNVFDERGDIFDLILVIILCDDWEVVEESEQTYDWDYIIKNKCLCRFWDIDSEEILSYKFRYLKEVDSRKKTFPYKDDFGYTWSHCRPVRRDEVTFYEDKEDEDNS